MVTDFSNWQPCPRPGGHVLEGRHVTLEPADFSVHAQDLFEALSGPGDDELWRWTLMGPFATAAALREEMEHRFKNWGTVSYVIRLKATGRVEGMFCYLRIREEVGSAEIGAVVFGKHLQRTAAATETVYLSAKHIFEECGYRRYEWKCNSRNKASRRAGERFGFTYEGTFRQDYVVKGESRDTDWLSMLDGEWPQRKRMFEKWLAPDNFDENGRQINSLGAISDDQ